MIYDKAEKELDLRLEPDDLTLERFSECLNYCEMECRWPVNRVVIRHAQKISLMKDHNAKPAFAAFSSIPTRTEFVAVFGVPIVEKEDGLTARERQIRNTLAELPPTRAMQVAAFEEAERKRQAAARDLKPEGWKLQPPPWDEGAEGLLGSDESRD